MTKIEFIKRASIAAMQAYIQHNETEVENKKLTDEEIAKKSVKMAYLLDDKLQAVFCNMF